MASVPLVNKEMLDSKMFIYKIYRSVPCKYILEMPKTAERKKNIVKGH